MLTGKSYVSSAQIVLPRVSGATKHVLVKDAKSMVSRSRVWTACVRLEKSESSAVLTNVKAKGQPLRQLRTQVSLSLPKLRYISYFPLGFPPTGEGPWVAPSDQPDGAPPGATPPIAPAQYMPPEGYWSYPYYPPPHGYVPPPDGHANGDGAPHGQPAHPAYYPIHAGYPPVPMYPPPPGAYGPIPTPSGQATEQTESNQAPASDDSRVAAERPKKKKRTGGEEGVSKSSKKSKRGTNSTSEAPAPVVATAPAPTSADSPDDHGSPVAHNASGGVGGDPLPPVIAAA
jgi:hypothetical protein